MNKRWWIIAGAAAVVLLLLGVCVSVLSHPAAGPSSASTASINPSDVSAAKKTPDTGAGKQLLNQAEQSAAEGNLGEAKQRYQQVLQQSSSSEAASTAQQRLSDYR